MEIEQTIDGKTVRLFRGGENDSPLVVLLSYQPCGEEVLTLAHRRASEPVNILEITGVRWHDELSPWPAEPAFRGDLGYRGEGKAFLNVLDKVILPAALESLNLHPAKTAIMGYSLAGLFALYAGMECDRFDAVISVSGSLWFDGFLDYAKQHRVSRSVQYVYLSRRKGTHHQESAHVASRAVHARTRRSSSKPWGCLRNEMESRRSFQ